MRLSFKGAGARGVVLVSAMLLSTAAFAADPKGIADSLVAAIQAKGRAAASYTSAEAAGDTITINDLKLVSKTGSTITVPKVEIKNAEERTPGGFTADSISFDGGTIVDKDTTVTWTSGVTEDAIVPDPSEMHSTAKLTPFTHMAIESISVSQKDMADPVTIASVTADLSNIVDGAPNEGKFAITDINVPGSVISADEQAKGVADQLGITSLNLNVGIEASYDTAKQALKIGSISFDGKDVGKLDISGSFSGLPRDKLQNADGLQELGATASLDNAKIRFDDAGITGKLLDMQAKQMGATRDSLATMLPAALPLAFSQLNITDAAFQQKVVDAVTAFLKDPKSFTISLAPAAPVLLSSVGMSAMSAPGSVPTMLGIDVQANQ